MKLKTSRSINTNSDVVSINIASKSICFIFYPISSWKRYCYYDKYKTFSIFKTPWFLLSISSE